MWVTDDISCRDQISTVAGWVWAGWQIGRMILFPLCIFPVDALARFFPGKGILFHVYAPFFPAYTLFADYTLPGLVPRSPARRVPRLFPQTQLLSGPVRVISGDAYLCSFLLTLYRLASLFLRPAMCWPNDKKRFLRRCYRIYLPTLVGWLVDRRFLFRLP